MDIGYERICSATAASAGGADVHVIVGIEPVAPGRRVVGRAFTVEGYAGDNLALHQAVARAERREVIVLDVQNAFETAHCGDMIVRCALQRDIGGIILNGSIRDRCEVAATGFPVFHRGTSPKPPTSRRAGHLRVPVLIDGVTITDGDLVIADDDGIVVVPQLKIDSLVARAVELEAREREVNARIRGGETTIHILDLAPDSVRPGL